MTQTALGVERVPGDPGTRARLIESADAIFSEKGYLGATVDHIIQRAGVARGTFYIYFRSKEHCFETLVDELVDELFVKAASGGRGASPYERFAAANRRYMEVFRAHAGLLASLYQVSTFNSRIGRRHGEIRQRFLVRIQRHIERNVERGVIRGLNPAVTATCLGLMVDWFAYLWIVKREFPESSPFDLDTVVQTISTIWYRALYCDQIPQGDGMISQEPGGQNSPWSASGNVGPQGAGHFDDHE